MELQQLRFFVVVSEQGSISAAASVLQASPGHHFGGTADA